ncbi:pimeloyl-ACP methyl ester carboxylesterase [Microbacterium ginsengiterrae]|uniref:Pimeloyl-ACP methyl ester carboxylesterase n=2 Tax=Microbacterium TaxID=33882 RepID=A0A7W9CEB7_9MICO|nr:alpha/beta fold hydrolase [Microbacterium ginsengiterrae]MBB5743913.1 pimeloyl-ACP methyl ester carboxylesterase [Microbacterium ginsengiterrae]
MTSAGRVLSVRRPAMGASPAFDLAYVRSGPRTPTPVVVIPGGPGLGSIAPYRSLRRTAARGGLDLIMVEHRGVGRSRNGLDGRRLPHDAMWVCEVVDDIAAVLDAEGVDTAFIAGSSYGSYLASSFGARHPDRVAGMLLDSALQSADEIVQQREAIRELFWDADTEIATAVRRLRSRGADDRRLLDVARAAHELGGERLLRPLLRNQLRGRLSPAWWALEAYAARDESIAEVPGHYEFAAAGAIGFRELDYGAAADGLPLDPALTYAPLAGRFPAFAGEPYDLAREAARFPWPLMLLVGDRDLRTPPVIARRIAAEARDAVAVPIRNGHSALDTHPAAFLNAVRFLVRGRHRALATRSQELDRLPRRGLSAVFTTLLAAAVRIESGLRRR